MKLTKSLSCSLAATVLATATLAPVANAQVDVSASAGVANLYLWRGFDLGAGDAAVFGDVTVSAAGFYGSVWTSSGDAVAGTEYDLVVGYGGAVDDFFYDLAVVSYVYPTDPLETNIGDWVEAILTLGYSPVSFSYYETVEAEEDSYAIGEDYNYYTLGGAFGDFGVTIGHHDYDSGDNDTHVDLSYSYSDRLSFVVSKMVDSAEGVEDDAHFVVSYTLPIE